jgi:D-glycero-D-manno-heptose 1,7-bisphosphate phosphatase
MKRRKAAFLDRDGVINADHAYVHDPAEFDILPGVVPALKLLAAEGHALVVITNQSGIARGLYTEREYERTTEHMRAMLALEGIELDGVYHCPHHPQAVIHRYRLVCSCRKPLPGLLHRAAADLDLDLEASVLVGDRLTDIEAGRAAGVSRCYIVGSSAQHDGAADAAFPSLLDCARTLCSRASL